MSEDPQQGRFQRQRILFFDPRFDIFSDPLKFMQSLPARIQWLDQTIHSRKWKMCRELSHFCVDQTPSLSMAVLFPSMVGICVDNNQIEPQIKIKKYYLSSFSKLTVRGKLIQMKKKLRIIFSKWFTSQLYLYRKGHDSARIMRNTLTQNFFSRRWFIYFFKFYAEISWAYLLKQI